MTKQKQKWLGIVREDPFRAGLLLTLFILFCVFSFASPSDKNAVEEKIIPDQALVHVFYSPECPHCRKELKFLDSLKEAHPDLKINTHNITDQQELDLMMLYAQHYKLSPYDLGTPFLIIGSHHLIGFPESETSGALIERWVKDELSTEKPATPETQENTEKKTLDVPFFGEISLFETSLPALAVVLGLVDGFNPCAMWVLVYLISLIVGLKDRTKIYTLVGTFLMASGILYFLFMTAWLNVFLLLGYIHTLTVLIGLAALYMGVMSVRGFFKDGGQIVCKVGNIESRQKTRSKIQELVASPLTWTSFAGIVVLAFIVNSIEFVCSAAMPAIFTHVLSVSEISVLSYYFYILLYVLFFMLDDLVIFMLAAIAVDRFAGDKYAGFCKMVGGVLMVVLGIILVFFPETLR